ncbi:hypothetical protein FXN65_23960 [Metapseudomonas lalkuanensis]|uniref:Uncharacterized protein n=1 Tax=Metapseudomonas lalkuanensis TaxID=2604832 RepID=A0A5J6QTK2_9GAMM|nr:hypothetical protein [Pseudomonas lalkuanensis]QEY64965.1 hypothetical protein FXN65_23960 [Pseudomonas lalkuanensis]
MFFRHKRVRARHYASRSIAWVTGDVLACKKFAGIRLGIPLQNLEAFECGRVGGEFVRTDRERAGGAVADE